MSRCIIHIGMHKTGTSSIQQSLNGYEDDALCYAGLGGHPNHGEVLRRAFAPEFDKRLPEKMRVVRSGSRDTSSSADVVAEAVETLEKALRSAGNRTFLLSSEGLSLFSVSELTRMREFLNGRFRDVTIMAAVRAPAAYMASAFQEPIKRGSKASLDLGRQYRNYRGTFEKFDEVFGSDNVELWKFDPSRFVSGCAVMDFCSRVGLSLPLDGVIRVNESLSREAMGLLFTYRKFGQSMGSLSMIGPQNQALVRTLMDIGDTKFRFSPEVIRPILEKNRADIEWMEERLEVSLYEELGEPRPGDVREEADLLRPDPEVVEKLRVLLGDRAPKGVKGDTPEEVALLIHVLRGKSVPNAEQGVVSATWATGGRGNAGKVMRATPEGVLGWAIGADVERPVRVALVVNGEEVAQVVADKPRPALKARGIHPTGRCGFAFRPEGGKALRAGDEVMVRPLDGDFAIGNSPCKVVARGEGETEAVEVEKRK